MIVREIQPGEGERWDAYVRNCPFSAPRHLYGWKLVMEEVFKSKTHYLLVEKNGNITGVLPLISIRSLVAGKYITSLPGGLCADDDETAGELLEHAKAFVRAGNFSYLILRDSRIKWDLPDLTTDEEHVSFAIEIPADLDLVKCAMKRQTRQHVNQASNNGLKAFYGLDKLSEYYPIYSKAMREFGNPTLGVKFFRSIANNIPGCSDLITLYHEGEIVGGVVVAPYKQTVYGIWSGLLQQHYALQTPAFMFWEMINYAHQNGYQCVDMGRCRVNSGGYKFKKGFGGQVQPLYQQFYLNGINQSPSVGEEMKEDLKYRIFVAVWNKVPLGLTEVLGPQIRKRMPFG